MRRKGRQQNRRAIVSDAGLAPTVLAMVAQFTPIQRVLLCQQGTLQATLSAYLGRPVGVELKKQEKSADGRWKRTVNLVADGKVVCWAYSTLVVDIAALWPDIERGELGIGRILEKWRIKAEWELRDVEQDDRTFSRRYTLKAPKLRYDIQETFEKAMFR